MGDASAGRRGAPDIGAGVGGEAVRSPVEMAMDAQPRALMPCPGCGTPIAWQRHGGRDGAEHLVVVGWTCFCPLTDAEWAALVAAAGEALKAQAGE